MYLLFVWNKIIHLIFIFYILFKLCFMYCSEVVVLDALTMERNHIIARAMVTGGPTERNLPPQVLPNVSI